MNDFIEKKYPFLIDNIYAAALNPNDWRSTMRAISEAFDGATCSMFITDPTPGALPFVVDWGTDETAIQQYAEHYIQINPYPEAALTRFRAGETRNAAECVSQGEIARSEFFNDWMQPNGWGTDHIGGVLYNDDKRVGIVALAPQLRNYENVIDEQKRNLSLLIPHLVRAFEINTALAHSWNYQNSMELFAEHISASAFILDHEDRVVHMNSRAEKLLDNYNILKQDTSGKLYASDASQNTSLQSMLHSSDYDPGNIRPASILRLSTRSSQIKFLAWVIHHNTMHSQDVSSRVQLLGKLCPSVKKILMIRELSARFDIPSDLLQAALSLTPAEAKIVSALARGNTLFQYADSIGVSRHTVRKQLTQIFTKLGVGSQPQLMSLVANLRDLNGG